MGAGSGGILSPTGLSAAGLSQGTGTSPVPGEMGHAMAVCVALSPQQPFERVWVGPVVSGGPGARGGAEMLGLQ